MPNLYALAASNSKFKFGVPARSWAAARVTCQRGESEREEARSVVAAARRTGAGGLFRYGLIGEGLNWSNSSWVMFRRVAPIALVPGAQRGACASVRGCPGDEAGRDRLSGGGG